jgi:hypothetical protein
MGVVRLFTSLVETVSRSSETAASDKLEHLVSTYRDFAYLGARRTLADLVVVESQRLAERIARLTAPDLERLARRDPALGRKVARAQTAMRDQTRARVDPAEVWFGRNWQKESGLFPDFVLAADVAPTFAKSLKDVGEIMGSNAISAAATIRDLPLSLSEGYLEKQRHCFYLLRTNATHPNEVRLSLVEGSFFETVPKQKLLEGVWHQLLEASAVPEANRESVARLLAELKQSEIAQSRIIPRAAVRPRLRLMAEVHSDANPHQYDQVGARTANLILKAEWEDDTRWIQEALAAEAVEAVREGPGFVISLPTEAGAARLDHFRITHRLNGPHLVLQYRLPRRRA